MKKSLASLPLLTVCICFLAVPVSRGTGNDNPTGVTGDYNGSVTTAGSYDPYTGNAKRTVEDLTVTGAVGAYPLKWTRTLNTRESFNAVGFGSAGAWTHNYHWTLWLRFYHPYHYYPDPYEGPDGAVSFPDGRTVELEVDPENNFTQKTGEPLVSIQPIGNGNYDVVLNDGGRVTFQVLTSGTGGANFRAVAITDPHGIETTFTHDASGRLSRITEKAGRYLQINYGASYVYNGQTYYGSAIGSVQAFAREGQLVETVRYAYAAQPMAYDPRRWILALTNAYYNEGTADATQATYTYYPDDSMNGPAGGRIKTCQDVRYAGAMKNIAYEYATGIPSKLLVAVGQVKREKNFTTGQTISEVQYPDNYPNPAYNDVEGWKRVQRRHEVRPDGSSRMFQYSGGELPEYTDFQNNHIYQGYGYGNWPGAPVTWNVTDARGNTTYREGPAYAPTSIRRGNHPPVRFTYTDGGHAFWVESRTDERGHVTTHQRYPDSHRISRTDYPDGGVEEFSYNQFGQVLTHRMTSGGTETFAYDEGLPSRGLKTRHTDALGNVTRYNYYQWGPHTDRLLNVIDPHGNATWFEYNLRGQVTKLMHQDGTFTQSGYNPDGTLAWTADENHPNASWNESERTRYTYDEYKRVLTVKNPMGETTTNNYAIDINWAQPLLHTTNSIKYTLSPLGKNVVFDYDANYRKTSQVSALGTADEAWTLFEYDEVGNLTKTTDPRFHVTTFGYDDRNRKIWMNSPIASDRNSNGHTMEWQYDDAGNKTKETRADDAFRSWEYDIPNRITRAIDWRMSLSEPAVITTSTRDLPNTEIVTIERTIDAKGAEYKFEFDALHRKIKATYPPAYGNAGPTELFWYDEVGNLKQYRNPAGQTKHLSYDNRNRLCVVSWDNDVAPITGTHYDAASRITGIETPETGIHYGYNDANRVIWENQVLLGYPTRWIEKAPDADGNATQLLVTTNGATDYSVHYDYTQRNQLAHITQNDYSPLYTYTYDRAGNMTMRRGDVLGDATNAPSNTYDALNRPTYWEQTRGGGAWFGRSHFQYDKVGREVATWREEDGNKGERFTFNTPGHLTRAEYKADNVWATSPSNAVLDQQYAYTADMLNRTSVTENGAVTNYATATGLNQYTNVGGVEARYDGNFNLTYYGGGTATYNAQNRLTSVNSGGSGGFVYDGLGRCVKRTINGVATVFAYDGWKPVTEYDGAGNVSAKNIYGPGPDEILMRGSGFGWFFYHADKQASVMALVGLDGIVAEKYTYDAFGKPTVTNADGSGARSSSNFGNRFMYTGREWIAELNIYDYRHRFYFPAIGRFLQTDPTGFDGGDMNLFRYCVDDPINHTDPTGLSPMPDPPQKIKEITVELQKFRTVTGSNIPQWVTVLKGVADGSLKAAFTAMVNAAVGKPIAGKPGKTDGDHVDRTQSVYTDGSFSKVSKAFHGGHWGSGGWVRDKFFTEKIPDAKPVGFLLHFHNDIQNVSTANPSGKDAAAVKSWQAPMLFSSESLYGKNQGVLLRPNGTYEPSQIPVSFNW